MQRRRWCFCVFSQKVKFLKQPMYPRWLVVVDSPGCMDVVLAMARHLLSSLSFRPHEAEPQGVAVSLSQLDGSKLSFTFLSSVFPFVSFQCCISCPLSSSWWDSSFIAPPQHELQRLPRPACRSQPVLGLTTLPWKLRRTTWMQQLSHLHSITKKKVGQRKCWLLNYQSCEAESLWRCENDLENINQRERMDIRLC